MMKDKLESGHENPLRGEGSEIKQPRRSARTVVSVAFQNNDYSTVSAYARRTGKKTSELIRDAALEKATGRGSYSQIYAFGNSGALWMGSNLPSVTRVRASHVEPILNNTALTSA